MSEQYHDDFFEGGGDGVPSFKFTKLGGIRPGYLTQDEQLGAFIVGTVISQETLQQTKMGTDEVLVDDKGRPKMQLRVVLQTELRNWDKCAKAPTDPEGNALPPEADDGRRAVYVKGWMKGAIADAIRAAKAPGLRPGGKLAVQVTELVPTTNGNPYAKYKAQYEAPAAGDQMFADANAAQAAQQAPPQQQYQQPQSAPAQPVYAQQAPVQQAPAAQPQQAPFPTQAPAQAPQQQPAYAGGGWAAGGAAYDEPPF